MLATLWALAALSIEGKSMARGFPDRGPVGGSSVKPITQRPFDLLVTIFLLTHIPVTLFIDAQIGKAPRFVKLANWPHT